MHMKTRIVQHLLVGGLCLAYLLAGCGSPEAQARAMAENKALARRIFDEAWSKGDLTVIDQVFDGNAQIKADITAVRAAFPDLRVSVDEQIAEANRVMTRVTFRGTQRGSFRDIPPTDKRVTWSIIEIHSFRGGKCTNTWKSDAEYEDLLQQLTTNT
jgi:predicted ester cyclase